jgi:pimeloyl-ACP methyl ester carboxylesterase
VNRRLFLAASALSFLTNRAARTVAQTIAPSERPWNLKAPTFGGTQVWADVWYFHQYRIQKNVLTGHHRLLDPNNFRMAWGSLEQCQEKLAEVREEESLPPMNGKGVVVLHGLFRTRGSMKSLCNYLSKYSEFAAFDVSYPTTRGSVADHAESLESVLQSLSELDEVHFVAHSLGNIVIRYWLHEFAEQKERPVRLPDFGRMVMLAPPNHQPAMAVALVRGKLIENVAGSAATDLSEGWEALEPKLAVPPFEFGILAGGRGNDTGYNPLLQGDDDGVVTVENTRLAGAADFRRVESLHSFVMNSTPVRRMTLRFLQEGSFEGERKRQPIS